MVRTIAARLNVTDHLILKAVSRRRRAIVDRLFGSYTLTPLGEEVLAELDRKART